MEDESRAEKRARIRSKRKLNALVTKVIGARELWLENVQSKNIKVRKKESHSDRGKPKKLYYVKPEALWKKLQSEVNEIKHAMDSFKSKGICLPRNLWVPTIVDVDNAECLTLKTYVAKSVRKVSLETAKKFAIKAGLEEEKYFKYFKKYKTRFRIASKTGRTYKFRVEHPTGTKYYQFTDWSVCICDPETLPKTKKRVKTKNKGNKEIEYTPRKDKSKIIICSHKNSTLYVAR